jgi:PAS domain-containing protein
MHDKQAIDRRDDSVGPRERCQRAMGHTIRVGHARNGEKPPCYQQANKPSRRPRSRRGPHAVVSADREGIIRDWNETAEHIFGHSGGQAIGRTLDLIVPEEECADHWRNFRRVMATGVLNYRPATCSISRDCDAMARA